MMDLQKYFTKLIFTIGSHANFFYASTVKCEGAWDNYGAYDRVKDAQYHANNPEAPICDRGYLTSSESFRGGRFVELDRLQEDNLVLEKFGTKDENELYIAVPSYMDTTNLKYVDIRGSKYVIDTIKEAVELDQFLYKVMHLRRGDNA